LKPVAVAKEVGVPPFTVAEPLKEIEPFTVFACATMHRPLAATTAKIVEYFFIFLLVFTNFYTLFVQSSI